jgi:hypothetical protein
VAGTILMIIIILSTNYFKRKTWKKKLKIDVDYVKNMKKLLTT